MYTNQTHESITETMTGLTIRPAREGDAAGLRRLAQRDSAMVPAGALLVAESEGRMLAAISIDDGALIADPFERTLDASELLRRRAAQLKGSRSRGLLRRPRRRAVPRLAPRPAGGLRPLR